MASILKPGYLRWDGSKFVLDPSVEIVGPPGPGFTANGDLSGNAVSQTVIGLQGHAVSSAAPTDQYVLTYSTVDGKWKPLTVGGDLAGVLTSQQVISLTGSGGLVNVPSSTSIEFGLTTDVATSGILRFDNIYNNASFALLAARDTTNNINIPLISSFGADNGTTEITIGNSSVLNTLILAASTLVKIQGPVNFSGLSTGIVHSTSGAITSSTLVNADVSASAAIAVSKLAAGTSAQILLNSGTPTPTWTTVSGDVVISNTGSTSVQNLTGSAGTIAIATTGAIVQWNNGTSSPTLKQADLTTNSGAGQTLTIQAQNETGSTSTGGALTLTSGTGTTANGLVNLQSGGTTIATISAFKFKNLKGLTRSTNFIGTTTPYAVVAADDIVISQTGAGAQTVNLPASPSNGDKYTLFVSGGPGAVTLAGNGHSIYFIGGPVTSMTVSEYTAVTAVYSSDLSTWMASPGF